MERHDCKPPEGRQPIDLERWTCPDCGDVWEARLPRPADPGPSYEFAADEHVTTAEWVRIHSGEGSPTVLTGTFGAPERTELRCSFCGKPGSAVRKLISGPGAGPSRVLICNECVDLCAEIIAEEQAEIEAEREEMARGRHPSGPANHR